ncbi:VWFA and cache domain-containing protein 1-like isoform X2 [Ostrea edulis]|uniref:VWFA and cache domain-containing protein 1-like isoform X2 n=1 Tax=Ostrea edulis TaxID=37623 RepID=UPI0024AF9E28|nr:VWFA and cache domain-containing protein 1-like isoform X2 [Ostrea edulis]
MNLYLVLVSLLPWVALSQDAQLLTGLKFSNDLERMDRNGIGAPNLQAYYDSLVYDKPTDTGAEIVEKMTNNLEKMFQTLTNQLKNVKKAITQKYDSFSAFEQGTFPQCCKINGTYNPKFRTEISENGACISVSTSSKHFPNKDIEMIMKKNYQLNPNMLWQYFGGSDGTFLIYPAQRFSSNCYSYDPRFRQYYVASATKKPKDVVVAVDISGVTAGRTNYESKTLLMVAREAVQYVIDTLNPNDRIGLVAFNEQAIKPTSCHGSQLVKATTTNKDALKDFTKDWTSIKQSNYGEGIQAAFSYFNQQEIEIYGDTRESLILFLAAGDNAGGDPVDIIKTENEARNNSVTILTYSFGQGVNSHSREVLRKMSKQVMNNASFGTVKEGTYRHVQNDSSLRSEMASYYLGLPSTNLGDNPVFSVPYVDRRSTKTGLVTSLCLPVDKSGTLVGVTCTDILLDELLSDITNFKQGELSYAFMIDGQGRVMVHYLQPTPNAITSDPDPIDIHVLEPSPDAKPMIDSMKRGESGNTTFKYLKTISRGILEYEGIEAKQVDADYSWKKVPGTNFSLCVVLGKNDQQSRLRPNQQGLSKDGVFYYHRLDSNSLFNGETIPKCREYQRYSTKERSMVMLTPHAFVTPYEYLYRPETQTEVGYYSNYLNDRHSTQAEEAPKLKDTVKSSIQASFKAEVFWKKNQNQSQFVIWRYMGTRDGHVRVYPAVEITKDYDHFMRPWWRRTVAQKGKNVVITPYVDNWGAGVVVTQCKAIYEGRSNGQHSSNDIVDVVQCIDYPYPYFSRMFLSRYPECTSDEYSCMVIDISGFLVIYPSFSYVGDNPDIELKHLGIKVHLKDTSDPINRLSSVGYKIAPVLHSNVYIIIKKKELLPGTCCQGSNISPLEYSCTSSGSDCCLCHKVVPYDTCQEKTTSGELYHICSARLPDSNTRLQPEFEKIKNLKPCFDVGCNTRVDESNCYQVAGCSWCIQDQNGGEYPSSERCCNIFETCPFGKVQKGKHTQCSKHEPLDNSESASEGLAGIIGGSAGGVVVLIIIVVIIIVFFFRKRNLKAEKKTTYLTVISENPAFKAEGDRISGSDHSIEYLREEERSHQSNQYIGVHGSDEGPFHEPDDEHYPGKRV